MFQQKQIVCDVDVIKGFSEASGKLQRVCACQQPFQRAAGSEPISFEQRKVSCFCADKIIASIVSRPDNHVVPRKYFEGIVQNCWRKVRTVTVEGNNVLPADGNEVAKHGGESSSQPFTLLRRDLHRIT